MIAEKRKGPIFMILASIMWSFGGVLIKSIPWGAMSIIGLRALFAAGVFAIYRRSLKIEFTRGNVLAALCLSATIILFVFANKLTTAAAAILLQFCAPVFILLIEFIFYRKKPRISSIIAVTVTILGMLLFFADRLEAGNMLGNILAIGSGISFAGVFVCNKRDDTDPSQSLFIGFLINAIVGLPFVYFQVTANAVAWVAIIVLGIVQVGLAYVFFSIGIKKTSAFLACIITALEPVLNPLLVMIVTKETPGRFAIIGGAIIVLTVVGYNVWVERHTAKVSDEPETEERRRSANG